MQDRIKPIKDPGKIMQIKDVLKAQSHRDLVLFVMGINIPIQIHDLIGLKISHVAGENGKIHQELTIQKKRQTKTYPLNKAIHEALKGYLPLKNPPDWPLFPSNKNPAEPMNRYLAYRILRDAGEEVGLNNLGSTTLRKTFGYHIYRQTGSLALAQAFLNQGSTTNTAKFLDIKSRPEVKEDIYYPELNL